MTSLTRLARLYRLPASIRDRLELRYDGPVPLDAIVAAEQEAKRMGGVKWGDNDAPC